MAPSCKLELARFSAWLRIQDGAECGNKRSKVICVPAALEGVFDDLKIEVNEGEMVHEFDIVLVGNGVMLKENDPK